MESREQGTGGREQGAGSREQGAGSRGQGAGNVLLKIILFIGHWSLVIGFLSAQSDQIIGLDFIPAAALRPYIATGPQIGSRSAVVIDAQTGTVLYAKNPHEEIPPASLTKLMTMHLVKREISAGRASFDEIVPVGPESWAQNQPPRSSLMFLAPGQTVTLREILLGLAVSSGNDAAVAAALRIAPSVEDFAAMMTREARRMGLVRTRFVEPSGVSPDNMTTAAEFALFCMEYVWLYPQSLGDFHSVWEFAYPKSENVSAAFSNNPNTIVQTNRNILLRTFPGVDGLKTGFIGASGNNIALTAQRANTRFIAVILGAPAGAEGESIRARDGEQLLSWAFANFKTVRPFVGTLDPIRLWKGRENAVSLQPDGPLSFTAPLHRAASISYTVEASHPLIAPLPAHFPVGALVFYDAEGELHRVQLLTERAYQQGNIFKRFIDSIRLFFQRGR